MESSSFHASLSFHVSNDTDVKEYLLGFQKPFIQMQFSLQGHLGLKNVANGGIF